MSFLNSSLIPLLIPFILVPLLIHLFNRKFPKRVIFSSIQFIKKTQAERSKLMRFRHLIMTVLRSSILLLLLLAFLGPLLEKFSSSGQQRINSAARDTLIIFDHSLSMEHRANLVSSRNLALQEAEKIISSLESGQNLNAIIVDREPKSCFFDFSARHTAVRDYLIGLKPGIQTANFEKAIALAARLVEKSKNKSSGADVYFISDFQRQNWASVQFDKIPKSARLFFVDVGSPKRENRAILDVKVSPSVILAGETINLNIKIGNYTNKTASEVPLELIVDYTQATETKFSCPSWSQTTINLSMQAPAPGNHTIELRLPKDDLIEDNIYHINLPVLDKEEVVLVTDRINPNAGAPRFVRTAVNPYKDLEGSLLPRLLPSNKIDSANLATTSKLILMDLGLLYQENVASLIQFLERGGGVIWFLDGEMDPTNLDRISLALDDEELPIRLLGWQPVESMPDGFQKVNRGNFKSEFLRIFRGSNRQNLGLLNFNKYRQATASENAAVILTFADGTPALAVASVGSGTLLLANFSIDEAHSNLARQRTFPAWLQDMVKVISSGEVNEMSFEAGTEITTPLWRKQSQEIIIKDPNGELLNPKKARDGERVFVSFPATQPGFYRLSADSDRTKRLFAVNPNTEESDLRLMDRDRLPKRANESYTDNETTNRSSRAHFVSGSDDYQSIQQGTKIFHWFILTLLIFLFIELCMAWVFRRASGS